MCTNSMTVEPEDRAWNTTDVAEFLQVSVRHVFTLRKEDPAFPRPVETLIALSIAVSAVHAIRPLAPRGEVLIAGGFGLVHCLAFASPIADLASTAATW
jgi:hypothetical protein